MPPLNSGNQDDSDRLVTYHIPALAIAMIAVPLLYLVIAFSTDAVHQFYLEWLAFLLLAIWILRGLITKQNALLIWLGVIANIVMPIALVITGFFTHQTLLAAHGSALAVLGALAWVPGLIVLESTGGALMRIHQRERSEESPLTYQSFSRALLVLVLLIGTAIFMYGEFAASGDNSTPKPLIFAIPFYLLVWATISLSKLVQKTYQAPHHPIVVPNSFISTWVGAMIGVLLIGSLIALVLPKHPLNTLMSRNDGAPSSCPINCPPGFRPVNTPPDARYQGPTHNYQLNNLPGNRPNNRPTAPGQHQNDPSGNTKSSNTPTQPGRESPSPDGTPQDSHGKGDPASNDSQHPSSPGSPPNATPADGNGPGTAPPQAQSYAKGLKGLLQRLAETGLDALRAIATAGERKQPQPHGQSNPGMIPGGSSRNADSPQPQGQGQQQQPGQPGQPQQGGKNPPQTQQHQQTHQPPPPPPTAEERLKAKQEILKKLLHDNPWRLVKIIAFVLLWIITLFVMFYSRRLKENHWLKRFGRWLLRPIQPIIDFFTTPFRERLDLNRREREIARLMREYDPFADPFEQADRLAQPQLIPAVYATFLAYLWLAGYERKAAQTEFDFAEWLEEHTPINARAVWTITRCCAGALYAQAKLTAEEFNKLHTALQTLIHEIEGKIPVDQRDARKERYRYREAERKYAAQHGIEVESPEEQPVIV